MNIDQPHETKKRDSGSPIYDSEIQRSVSRAIARLEESLRSEVPNAADQIINWMRSLSNSGQAEDRLTDQGMFPILLMPWWLGQTIAETPPDEFHENLIFSTFNGYYYIRLLDNLMDHETTCELQILPAAGFFHTQFQLTYQTYFGPDHPFWNDFRQFWFDSAEFAIRDAELKVIDRIAFDNISAKKICATKIPLAAVCHASGRRDLLPEWLKFCDAFGCFQQMYDDMSDWIYDATRTDVTTFFLSEARRRKLPDETVTSWVTREGFSWGIDELNSRLSRLKLLSPSLGSEELEHYLIARQQGLDEWKTQAEKCLVAIDSFRSIFRVHRGT